MLALSTTAASIYWFSQTVWYLYLLRSADYGCVLHYIKTLWTWQAIQLTHWSFPASLALLVATQEPRARRGLIKTPGRALCRGKWEHIKSKWSAGTRLSFLLAPLLVQWPCFTTFCPPSQTEISVKIFLIPLFVNPNIPNYSRSTTHLGTISLCVWFIWMHLNIQSRCTSL